MQVQVEIDFEELLLMVKKLSLSQLQKLKAEIEREGNQKRAADLESILLNGPTATEQEIDIILDNKKTINQWRNP